MARKTSRPVVVITDHRDAHLPFVQKHLDTPLVVLDPTQFAEGKELTFYFESGKTVVVYDGARLTDVAGVWYRKPLPIDANKLPLQDDFKDYSKSAMQRHVNLLLVAFENATWVSDYFAILRASNKSLQLAIAQRLGMQVPETVITSDKKVAEVFIAEHPRCVTKPLTINHPIAKGTQKAFFTTLLKDGFVPDLSNLHLAPAIFQQAVDIVYDVRVIVIGDKVFAATIHAEGLPEDTRVYDYRLANYGGKVVIEAHNKFPEELAKLCVAHTRALGLRFGALDFVLDKHGTYWFLENNPNGQWAFVEEETGQPIGKAMAGLLSGGK